MIDANVNLLIIFNYNGNYINDFIMIEYYETNITYN